MRPRSQSSLPGLTSGTGSADRGESPSTSVGTPPFACRSKSGPWNRRRCRPRPGLTADADKFGSAAARPAWCSRHTTSKSIRPQIDPREINLVQHILEIISLASAQPLLPFSDHRKQPSDGGPHVPPPQHPFALCASGNRAPFPFPRRRREDVARQPGVHPNRTPRERDQAGQFGGRTR